MNKIEQVKEVLNRHCHFCKQDKCDSNENISKEINALYSEPQVCPKPEQMVICPECKGVGHWLLASMGTAKVCPKCNGTGNVPAQPQQQSAPSPEPSTREVYALFAEGKFQYFIKTTPPTSADNLVVQADIVPTDNKLNSPPRFDEVYQKGLENMNKGEVLTLAEKLKPPILVKGITPKGTPTIKVIVNK